MNERFLCNLCSTVLDIVEHYVPYTCECGKLCVQKELSKEKRTEFKVKYEASPKDYALVDEKGTPIYVTLATKEAIEEIRMGEDSSDAEVLKKLMKIFRSQIENLEELSPQGKFSPVPQQYVLYHYHWLEAVLEVLLQRVEKISLKLLDQNNPPHP